MKTFSILLALALVGFGCQRDSSAPTRASAPSKPAGAEPAREVAAASAKSVAAAPAPAVSRAAALELVAKWVAAQNSGDFAAYETLYASRFTGIKRAGEKATRFDRAGWLNDRKAMFERGFRLEANDVSVRTLGASVAVAVQVHVHADDHDPVDEDVGLAGHQLAGRCTKRSISCTF